MSDIKDLPQSLPSPQHTFIIDLVGQASKKRFVGEFVCKITTLKDQARIASHEATLNGVMGEMLPNGIRKLNKMIAYLRFTVVEFPKFWKDSDLGYELMDLNIIEGVYEEVLAFEDKWLESLWGKQDEQGPEATEG